MDEQCKNCREEFDRRIKVNEDNIKDLFEKTNKHALLIERMTTLFESVSRDISEIKVKLESLNQRPGAMWDKLIFALITAAVGGLVGYIVKGG